MRRSTATWGEIRWGTLHGRGRLKIPNLVRLGLADIKPLEHLTPAAEALGSYGKGATRVAGEGHDDRALGDGRDLADRRRFQFIPDGFPKALIAEFEAQIGRRTLGNKPASGTEILKELGDEHCAPAFRLCTRPATACFKSRRTRT